MSIYTRLALFAFALINWFAAAAVQRLVRGSVQANAFDVWGFTDWSPSFFYAFGLGLFFLGWNSRHRTRDVTFVIFGALVYEMLQSVIPERTLDWHDILATFAALSMALVVSVLIPTAPYPASRGTLDLEA